MPLEDFFITESTVVTTIKGHYDYPLVLLSYIIASIASFVALDMASNISNSKYSHIDERFWLYGGAFAMGGGIWSMHFIGMLAYNSGMQIHYNSWITLLSMAIAILFSLFALSKIKAHHLTIKQIIIYSPTLGIGIAAMHYIGMAAMVMQSELRYRPELFALSILIAIAASAVAFWLVSRTARKYPGKGVLLKIAAALIIGWAVCGMHYTGMAASVFIPSANANIDFGTSSNNAYLSLAVAAITTLVLGIAIIASIVNQRFFHHLEQKIQQKTKALTRTEKASKSNELRMQMILDHIIDGVISVNKEGEIQSFNKAAEKIFGYSQESILGKDITILMPKNYIRKYSKHLKKHLNKDDDSLIGAGVREAEGIRKDGRVFTMDLGVNELEVDNEKIFIGVIRDITYQKKYEAELKEAKDEAERATRAKSDFLANMSHEIRTPMNAVIGMTRLLLDTGLKEEQRTYAEIVRKSGETLLDLINDILDFSKIEAGQLTLEPIAFNLYTAIEEALGLLKIKAEEQKIELLVHYSSDVPHYFFGDPGRIRQIIINLMSNAIKFTQDGYVLLSVTYKGEEDNIANLYFEVKDTGIGIPKDKQDYIFNKFSQAEESTTRKFGGTGLGLAICKNLVSMMDGIIGVKSELGKGSTFHFNLKLPLAQEEEVEEKPNDLTILNLNIANLHVLIVDAYDVNRYMMTEYVKSWKMRSDAVGTAEQAWQLLKKAAKENNPYHFVLLDFQLPKMDGITLAKKIKKDASLKNTLLIMITSSGHVYSLEEVGNMGFSAFLTKPFYPPQLLNAINIAWDAKLKGEDIGLITQKTIAETILKGNNKHHKNGNLGFAGVRVLVVEDMPINQMLMINILERIGCKVDTAANGMEAIDILKSMKHDIVFMDCQMPEMDGFEATNKIRKIEKEKGGHIPIIALTADAMLDDKEKCIRLGMDDYLNKPVKPENIEMMLKKHVKGHSHST